jgi:ubiquitin-conjugating enzyme E2 O
VIANSCTSVCVRWADGAVEENIGSLRLCPRPHISAHDFLPHDFVARSDGGSFALPAQEETPLYTSAPEETNEDLNISDYGYPAETQEEMVVSGEILPMEAVAMPQVNMPLGVVTSVNLQARTAVVQWTSSAVPGSEPVETEEVSVFELTDHPSVDVRLGDAVLVPHTQDSHWAGRVSALRFDGGARVELLDGTSQWLDVRTLVVVDDGEISHMADDEEASQSGSEETRSNATLSDISAEASTSGGSCDFAKDRSPSFCSCRDENDSTLPADEEEAEEEVLLGRGGQGAIRLTEALDEVSSDRSEGSSLSCRRPMPDAVQGSHPGFAAASSYSAETSACLASGGSSSSSSSPFGPSGGPCAFDMCDEDVEPSDHFFLASAPAGSRHFMAAVRRELAVLRKGLDGSQRDSSAPILVRTFSSRSDLFRCMVVGPPDTPYALVPFFFDVALPAEYPREPPLVHFFANYVGHERLNPNLYVDGKVCLSLLGTWSGPAWDSQQSTMLQVLVSLQGLVLVEEPYFNEPGHECDVGTEQGRQSSALYNEHARLLSLRAALNCALSPPKGFEEIVKNYFECVGPRLLQECEEALCEPRASKSSEGFRKVLAKSVLPRLRDRWGSHSDSTQ